MTDYLGDRVCKLSTKEWLAIARRLCAVWQGEPVAWIDLDRWESGNYSPNECFNGARMERYTTPLYAAPASDRTAAAQPKHLVRRGLKLDGTYPAADDDECSLFDEHVEDSIAAAQDIAILDWPPIGPDEIGRAMRELDITDEAELAPAAAATPRTAACKYDTGLRIGDFDHPDWVVPAGDMENLEREAASLQEQLDEGKGIVFALREKIDAAEARRIADLRQCVKLCEQIPIECGGSLSARGMDPLLHGAHSDAHDDCHAAIDLAEAIRAAFPEIGHD